MKFNKLLYRYLRQYGILPKLDVIINKRHRNIQKKKLTYNLNKSSSEKTYAIKGSLYAPILKKVSNKAALLSLNFFDKHGKAIKLDSLQGFSKSKKVGYYKYIPVSSVKNSITLYFTPPPKCRKVKISIVPWEEKKADIYLSPNLTIQIISSDFSNDQIGMNNDFISLLSFKKAITQKEAEDFIKKTVEKFSLKQDVIAKHIFDEFKDSQPYIAKYFGRIHFLNNPGKTSYDSVYTTIQKSGAIKEKRDFIQQAKKLGFDSKELRINKAEEEYQLFEEGFKLAKPSKADTLEYTPKKEALYLLHNSLPYNSGGYATRTHGLINNIANISDFNISALARPGFPSDHKQYISHELPSPIPRSNQIDNIEYFVGDQDIIRSSLLFSEYIQAFTNDIKALAIEKKASIIHAASNYPNGFAAINAARELGIKSAYEIRGLWEITRISRDPFWQHTEHYKLAEQMEVQALQNADIAFTITGALKDLMLKRGVERDDIHVIPNAVDVEKFTPISKDMELAQQLGLQDSVVIGYVGSVVEYEGLDDLLRACAKLVAKRIDYFKLLIVGDGAYHSTLKKLVKDYNLEQYVIFTGRVPHDEVQKYISVIDIMPFPRKPYLVCEAVSPLKPFESLASEKAVIVSSCAALKEIIKHNERGLVFKKGDIDDLAAKLLMLIYNPALRQKLAANGLKWVKAERDWKVVAKKVADIYEEVAEKAAHEGKQGIVNVVNG